MMQTACAFTLLALSIALFRAGLRNAARAKQALEARRMRHPSEWNTA